MAVVTNAEEQFRIASLRAKFSRLSGLAAKQEAEIERDPLPHLIKVAEENAKLRRAIEEGIHALDGMTVIKPFTDEPPRMINPAADFLGRISEAKTILRKAID